MWMAAHAGGFILFVGCNVILVATMLGTGRVAARQGPRTVVAGRFVLQDDAGSVRGQWWVEGGTAKFALYDAAGNLTIQAASKAEGGAVVSLHDPDGAQRAALGLSPDGSAALSLKAGNQVGLVAGKDGSVGWMVRDKEGKVRAGLGMDAKGAIEQQ
jgi:hypothetical protein